MGVVAQLERRESEKSNVTQTHTPHTSAESREVGHAKINDSESNNPIKQLNSSWGFQVIDDLAESIIRASLTPPGSIG